jgi:hypothetical protein
MTQALLLGRVRPGDTIITLNYDLITDCTLSAHPWAEGNDGKEQTQIAQSLAGRLRTNRALLGSIDEFTLGGNPMGTHFDSPLIGLYLKLHGSLDWQFCPRAECANNKRIWVPEASWPCDTENRSDLCSHCGYALETVIVPPTGFKDSSISQRLSLLWSLALRKISESDRIVFYGVSMAATDTELEWLIRQGVELASPNHVFDIVVINPDKAVQKRIVRLFGSRKRRAMHMLFLKDFLADDQRRTA